MAYQHREFQYRLGDAERLRLYAQSAISDQKSLSASLMEVEASSRRWESDSKEAVEKVVRAEAERDATRYEASMARLDAKAAGSARAQVESKLARVQHALAASEDARKKGEFKLTGVRHALAASEEARRKVDDKASFLADERVSLLLELGASKDELSAFQAEASKEKGFGGGF